THPAYSSSFGSLLPRTRLQVIHPHDGDVQGVHVLGRGIATRQQAGGRTPLCRGGKVVAVICIWPAAYRRGTRARAGVGIGPGQPDRKPPPAAEPVEFFRHGLVNIWRACRAEARAICSHVMDGELPNRPTVGTNFGGLSR